MAETLELRIDGRVFSDWTSVRVVRTMESIADTIAVNYTDREALRGEMLSIEEESPFTLKLDGEEVATGYIDDVTIDYDANRHSFTASGRSATGDLVDCSAIHETGSWEESDIITIANDLCAPFGLVPAIGEDGILPETLNELFQRIAQKFRKFSIETGETVFEALDRMAKARGLVWVSKADGNPSITKNGGRKAASALVLGKNILSGRRRGSSRDRFSEYFALSQSAGDDGFNGESARGGFATTTDEQVTRYRPHVFMSEGTAASGDLDRRVAWERNRRAGAARTVSYTVVGWTDGSNLWAPNTLVDVDDDFFRIKDQLLITEAALEYSLRGSRATLEVRPPQSLDPLQPPKTRRNRGTWTQWA